MRLAFWRPKGAAVDQGRPKKVRTYKPWQLRQLFGLDAKGKPLWEKIPPSIDTRQRRRAALRLLCFQQITKEYGGEPRKQRRLISLRLARRSYTEMKAAA